MRCLGRITCALLLTAAAASAQIKETIEVHLVEVPVTVIDRAGNPIRGLTASNFEILDQGKKREIRTFDTIDFASPDSMRATSALNANGRRSFLLLFDLSFSSPAGRAKAEEAARNFLARGMQRRDLAAVGTIDVSRSFRMLTAFTTDRTLLVSAVANPVTFVSSDPLQIASGTAIDLPTDSKAPQSEVGGGRAGEFESMLADVARLERRMRDDYLRDRIDRQLRLLGELAKTLRAVPGRKQVIFFTEGFDPRLVQGRDARDSAGAADDMAQTTSANLFRVDSNQIYGSSSSMRLLGEMARMFRGSDVVLHAVDIQGVRVQNTIAEGSVINSNDALHLLSNPTGGEVFENSNDVNADLAQILRRQEVVYVVGFHAPASNRGKFHQIKVKVSGAPGAQVFHRAGYYDSGALTPLERSLTAAEIILNDIPQSDLRIAALAAPFATRKNAVVPIVVDISGPDLMKSAKNGSVAAEVYVYAFDDEGIARDRMFQRVSLDISKVGERLRDTGVKYMATLSLPPGRYALKTLVRTADDRKGYARTDVEVHGFDDVALLPPLFIDDPSRWVLVRGGTHAADAPYPFHFNGEPFVPSASVAVQKGEARRFAVFVANAAAGELSWEATVTDPLGRAQSGAPSLVKELQAAEMTKLLFDFAPGDLQSGAATFDMTVRKKGSSDTRKSSVALVIHGVAK
jgi:VWFA-related protein